jgi:hypothetical protein
MARGTKAAAKAGCPASRPRPQLPARPGPRRRQRPDDRPSRPVHHPGRTAGHPRAGIPADRGAEPRLRRGTGTLLHHESTSRISPRAGSCDQSSPAAPSPRTARTILPVNRTRRACRYPARRPPGGVSAGLSPAHPRAGLTPLPGTAAVTARAPAIARGRHAGGCLHATAGTGGGDARCCNGTPARPPSAAGTSCWPAPAPAPYPPARSWPAARTSPAPAGAAATT